jgi:hypothetical protein
MTDGEALYLIGVIALFVVFSAVLAYSQITSDSRGLRKGAASRTCLACPYKTACEAWLANDNPGFEPPASCPNAGYFRVVANESRSAPLNRARHG